MADPSLPAAGVAAILASARDDLVVSRPEGLYCPPGDFFIDPWQPVDRAIITHAHGDHLRAGNGRYLTAEAGRHVVRARVGDVQLDTLPYGQTLQHRGVTLSFHPAGHVLGSAQVRLSHGGRTWVVSGDYKTVPDRTCTPFEPVRCDVFITESTFGLPVFRWAAEATLFADLDTWWRDNAAAGRVSVVYAYSFGKAQRLLAGVDPSIGPILVHGAVETLDEAYRASGVDLPPTRLAIDTPKDAMRGALVVAPPSVQGSAFLRRFGDYSDAFASGWMLLRGARRRRSVDRGFILSDHADWTGLLDAIRATGAPRVIVTHGYVAPLVRYLGEQGWEAGAFKTEYGDDDEEAPPKADATVEPASEPRDAADTDADRDADTGAADDPSTGGDA